MKNALLISVALLLGAWTRSSAQDIRIPRWRAELIAQDLIRLDMCDSVSRIEAQRFQTLTQKYSELKSVSDNQGLQLKEYSTVIVPSLQREITYLNSEIRKLTVQVQKEKRHRKIVTWVSLGGAVLILIVGSQF